MCQAHRVWINQPSTLQDYHQWHGARGLAVREFEDIYRVYFVEGRVESMRVPKSCLVFTWEGRGAGF